MWRSQTLRMLYPPLFEGSSTENVQLHTNTDGHILRVAKLQSAKFIAGPARVFINPEMKDASRTLDIIFQEAAVLSYQLWTRRTAIKCTTLKDSAGLTFNINNPRMEPHTLVRYDDHEDQLLGKPITVLVHPLVEVYGTDEGEDYNKSRIWVPGEVWLDSRQALKGKAKDTETQGSIAEM